MSSYFVLAGTFPQLSQLEVKNLIGSEPQVTDNVISLGALNHKQALDLFEKSGSLVKLIQKVSPIESEDQLYNQVSQTIASQQIKYFSFTNLTSQYKSLTNARIKVYLERQGINARFPSNSKVVNSASLLHKAVSEIVLFSFDQQIFLGQTIVVQDIDEWTKRDRHKPFADHKMGMLPPKLARTLVNLAQLKEDQTLLDPFCGSGTVLMEGMLLGLNVIGSDSDQNRVGGAGRNLAWIEKNYQTRVNYSVITSDATHIDQRLNPSFINAIVTEPFMGKLTPQDHEIDNILKGLYKLYLGCFKSWQKILVDEAKVIITLPIFQNRESYWEKLVDKLALTGYTIESKPVIYARPGSITKRQITIFKLKK